MNIKIRKPYSDSQMTFNENSNQYELTMEYVKDNFEITYKDDETLKRRIKLNSSVVYKALKYRGYNSNRQIIEWMLNNTEEGRKFLLDVLTSQMRADLLGGYNDLLVTSPINVVNGQSVDPAEYYRNMLCPEASITADECNGYFGFNLLVQTAYPPYLDIYFRGLMK